MLDGRSVFITGHTGFKGGWLSLWLADRGAAVHGYATPAPTRPSFFEACGLGPRLASSTIADIRDQAALGAALEACRPDVIFHLAAQPLVRHGYADPLETFDTNVIGTARVLDAARRVGTVRAVVVVTTDKCYHNREWEWSYRERDRLGGRDPYSASKACAELVTQAYRHSFLDPAGIAVATARAGNVIGGGDWAADRLVPDMLAAFDGGRSPVIRSPDAVRPWQHVLEPLSGYLLLAERLLESGTACAGAWNFGPEEADMRSVGWIADRLCRHVAGASWRRDAAAAAAAGGAAATWKESLTLKLDSSKARHRLGWRPRWSLDEALRETLRWHHAWRRNEDMAAVSLAQIAAFERQERTCDLSEAA